MIIEFERVDDNSNIFSFKNNVFSLKLKSDTFIRKIGILKEVKDNYILEKQYNSAKHIFKKNNSLGICYELLKLLPDTATIRFIEDCTITRFITVAEAKKVGDFMFFKEQGFEKQFFIPIAKMKSF